MTENILSSHEAWEHSSVKAGRFLMLILSCIVAGFACCYLFLLFPSITNQQYFPAAYTESACPSPLFSSTRWEQNIHMLSGFLRTQAVQMLLCGLGCLWLYPMCISFLVIVYRGLIIGAITRLFLSGSVLGFAWYGGMGYILATLLLCYYCASTPPSRPFHASPFSAKKPALLSQFSRFFIFSGLFFLLNSISLFCIRT